MNNNSPLVFILHAYQPPTQKQEILDRIVNNCYLPLANALLDNSDIKITLNMNASLTEQLDKDYPIVIEKFAELANNGQVEFLDSGAYHPILPLLSQKEAKLQIDLNKKINRSVIGNAYDPIGFWPPELAVSQNFIVLLESLGYKYTIIPEISVTSNPNIQIDFLTERFVHKSAQKVALLPRNKMISNKIAFRTYPSIEGLQNHIQELRRNKPPESLLVCAMDAETFGEHHRDYLPFLIEFLKRNDSFTANKILDYPKKVLNNFRSASWSTSEEDLYRNIPFPLWAYPNNAIHDILNIHLDLLSECLELLLDRKSEDTFEVKQALKAVAKAQYSCQNWWASTKDHYSKELIRTGFKAQKIALMQLLMALGDDCNHSIVEGLSDKLEKRLERYLNRI